MSTEKLENRKACNNTSLTENAKRRAMTKNLRRLLPLLWNTMGKQNRTPRQKTRWSSKDDQLGACAGASQVPHEAKNPAVTSRSKNHSEKQLRAAENSKPASVQSASVARSELEVCVRKRILAEPHKREGARLPWPEGLLPPAAALRRRAGRREGRKF